MTTLQPGLVSVIVAVYNSEPWLAALGDCLRSQSMPDWEAILVLDGPTDASADIARALAADDSRIRVLELENGGAGRARNRGLEQARGEFTMFVDSDDLVPSDAFEHLRRSLQASGSEVVTGFATQFLDGDDTSRWPYWTMEGSAHRQPAVGVALNSRPELILDHTPWNKMFRTGFLRDHGIEFPEGTTCEDVTFCAGVWVAATAVDIISETVYVHRRRAGSVTTSGHFSPGALADWATQTRRVTELVRRLDDEAVSVSYFRRHLHGEAWTRASQWVTMPPESAELVAAACDDLFTSAPEQVRRRLPATKFCVYTLMSTNDVDSGRLLVGRVDRCPSIEQIRTLAARVGARATRDVSTTLVARAVLEPLLLDPRLDAAPAEAAVAELAGAIDLHRLGRVSEYATGLYLSLRSTDRATSAAIRITAATNAPGASQRVAVARRGVSVASSDAGIGAPAHWVAADGRVQSPRPAPTDRGIEIAFPDAVPGERWLLLLSDAGAAPVPHAVRAQPFSSPKTARFAVETDENGFVVAIDRGALGRRARSAVGRRLRGILGRTRRRARGFFVQPHQFRQASE